MSLKQNLDSVTKKIKEAAKQSDRDPRNVHLVAVSKQQPLAVLKQAYDLGLRHFGENYVQEWLQKKSQWSPADIQWHFIGHLQSNKVKDVVGSCGYIHSVDRLSLAKKISTMALDCGVVQKIFLQVNLAGEDSKSGISENLLESLFFDVVQLEGIQTCGLMIMPPLVGSAEESRRYFAKGKKLQELLKSHLDSAPDNEYSMTDLSMGTSQDFGVAVQEGATWIRLGSTLLGERVNS